MTGFTGDCFRTLLDFILRIFYKAVMLRLLGLFRLLLGTDIGIFCPARHIGGFIQRLNILDNGFSFDFLQCPHLLSEYY